MFILKTCHILYRFSVYMCVYIVIQIIMIQSIIPNLQGQWVVFLVKKFITHLNLFKMKCL